jgi:hypothetical protein
MPPTPPAVPAPPVTSPTAGTATAPDTPTATEDTPWYVVPADHKWFTRVVVAAAVIDALASLNLHYPQIDEAKRKELALARKVVAGLFMWKTT